MALELLGVSKTYGDVIAVDKVSLCIEEGERAAVLGSSGSGKSTLLHLIAGLLETDTGRVLFRGKDLDKRPFMRDVAMVFQEPALWNHMTIEKNIAFGCPVRGRRERSRYVGELAQKLGIAHLLKRYPGEISGGQARRAAIARALACQRKILLLDEAFINLDEETKKQTMDVVRLYCENASAVLWVTHDEEEAQSFCSTIYRMEKGKLVRESTDHEKE